MAVYQMRFRFDWGSGVCLWSANDTARARYGYPVMTEDLPIGKALKDALEDLIERHDEALDWNDPGGDLLWDDAAVDAFLSETEALYHRLCEELGETYEVTLELGM